MDTKDDKMKELMQDNAWINVLRGPMSNFNVVKGNIK